MLRRRAFLAHLAATPLLVACKREGEPGSSASSTGARDETLGPLIEPEELAAMLADPQQKAKVAVFQVGPKVLFDKAHVPGATYVGEAGTDEGYRALVAAAAAVRESKPTVVVYCGCCPFRDCPNARPALRALLEAKHPGGKLLDLPKNFRTNWQDKGLPVEKS
jgi:3-mercaptopyruvate sulfurtransferase SseA